MSQPVCHIDRKSRARVQERIYSEKVLRFLYGKGPLSKGALFLLSRLPIFSKIIGAWQKSRFTRSRIAPFIEAFEIDAREFEKDPSQFDSFNDFFIRKLKKESRPIDRDPLKAISPADSRALFFQDMDREASFLVKHKSFALNDFLRDDRLASRIEGGSLMIMRLAPCDYHRFHFPFDCVPSKSRLINGPLYSVNPIALKQNIGFLLENKRKITELESDRFGLVLMVEVGATSVGTIVETYRPLAPYSKGDEKGYFSFGGSAILLFFEKGRIEFDPDLRSPPGGLEIRLLMGQSIGKALCS